MLLMKIISRIWARLLIYQTATNQNLRYLMNYLILVWTLPPVQTSFLHYLFTSILILYLFWSTNFPIFPYVLVFFLMNELNVKIWKSGYKSEVNYYCPISKLSTLPKLFWITESSEIHSKILYEKSSTVFVNLNPQ